MVLFLWTLWILCRVDNILKTEEKEVTRRACMSQTEDTRR